MKENLRELYSTFIYDSYKVNKSDKGIEVIYTYKIDKYVFTPNIFISNNNISNKNINEEFLNYLFFNFGIINAINYYKLTYAKEIIINAGYLNNKQKDYFKKLFYNGLAEFFYVNNLNLSYDEFVTIKTTGGTNKTYDIGNNFTGNLIPIGGGKDSIVTLELLKDYKEDNKCFLYNRNIYPVNKAAMDTISLAGYNNNDIIEFNVTLDKLMLDLNKEGFYNGHIPFSSCLAFASIISAYLNNKKYVVLSNEASANEANIKGTNINHQYSKSFEFEYDFRSYLKEFITDKIEYFSLLRCWNEYEIVKEFIKHPKYLDIFRSCNRGTKTNSWCGCCSKCLYVYIMLYPHVKKDKLISIFKSDMLDNIEYLETFKGLVSDTSDKPFECVGTKEEIDYSLSLAIKKDKELPELLKYYKDNLYNEQRIYNVENYFNKNNAIPKEYINRMVK